MIPFNELNDGILIIQGAIDNKNFTDDIKNIYIFLENKLTDIFYDIYKNDIEDKTLAQPQYKEIILKMLKKNGVNAIFIVDEPANEGYYIDVCDEILKDRFANDIVAAIY